MIRWLLILLFSEYAALVNWNEDGSFIFLDANPVIVCAGSSTPPNWTPHIQLAVDTLNTVIPTEYNAAGRGTVDGCNVMVYVVDELPEKCAEYIGCTYVATDNHSTRRIFVRRYVSNPSALILHELLHALGAVGHSPHASSVLYYIVHTNQLSAWDIELINFLYSQN